MKFFALILVGMLVSPVIAMGATTVSPSTEAVYDGATITVGYNSTPDYGDWETYRVTIERNTVEEDEGSETTIETIYGVCQTILEDGSMVGSEDFNYDQDSRIIAVYLTVYPLPDCEFQYWNDSDPENPFWDEFPPGKSYTDYLSPSPSFPAILWIAGSEPEPPSEGEEQGESAYAFSMLGYLFISIAVTTCIAMGLVGIFTRSKDIEV